MLMGVADHSGYAGQRRNFLGSALGVASRDNNLRQRILALHAPDGGARVLIGGTGYGAGIQYDEVGLCCRGWVQPPRCELAFEDGAVGLSGAASEVFHVVGGHGTIVAQSAACAQSLACGL